MVHRVQTWWWREWLARHSKDRCHAAKTELNFGGQRKSQLQITDLIIKKSDQMCASGLYRYKMFKLVQDRNNALLCSNCNGSIVTVQHNKCAT
jgi:hypothetical protein